MQLEEKLKKIKMVIFDVDGVLTDGRLYYSKDQELLKVFNVKDGVAFKLLPTHSIYVGIISAKESKPLKSRIDDLGVEYAFLGVKDKLSVVETLCQQLGLSFDDIAYVGDDMVDFPVLEKVGVSFMPSDGYHLLESICDIKLNAKGGMGVAREVCDLLLASRGDLMSFYHQAKQDSFNR
ncbi:KdsC family phosphatase [Marinicellulosiphila megalodicopiae]|uniref:KdsC family phosphatase n=1 Tax=Marinicellulosiphila megalodicopiae TaxID=2724896 RepID=UPI003BB0399A